MSVDVGYVLGNIVDENVTCSKCNEQTHDIHDGGEYREGISHTIAGYSKVEKVYVCLNCIWKELV